MISLSILDVFLLIAIGQGIFIAVGLCFIKGKNTKANQILSIVLFLCTIMLLGRLFYSNYGDNILLFRFGSSVDTIIFLIGPLIYIYLKTTVFVDNSWKTSYFLMFIPAILHLGFVLWCLSLTGDIYIDLLSKGSFNSIFFLTELFGLLCNFYFCFKSLLLLQDYAIRAEQNLAFKQAVLTYMRYFLLIYIFVIVIWFICFIGIYVFSTGFQYINYNLIWIVIPVMFFLIGFYSLRQPEVFQVPMIEKKTSTYVRTDEIESKRLQEALEHWLGKEKLYREHNLTLTRMAELSNTTSNNLSWLLNQVHKSSFYEFINRYRIAEFLDRIDRGHHKEYTIRAISYDVGFNSKSSFYKAFKMHLGKTPSEYIKQLEV